MAFVWVAWLVVTASVLGAPAIRWEEAPTSRKRDKAASGTLLIVGGGKTTRVVVEAFLRAAGGPNAPIVVLAQTEAEPEKDSPLSIMQFTEAGAKHVAAPVGASFAKIKAALNAARGVWIPGGDQNRFTTAFPESSGVPEAIRAVYRRGGVVGGTSAGASLLGEWMPTGADVPEAAQGLRVGGCPVAPGLKLLPGAIIDQHFFARNRLQRLLVAVLEHPRSVGIGVEQGGWCLVRGQTLTVGAEQVAILQSRGQNSRRETQLGANFVRVQILLQENAIQLAK